VCVCVCVCVTIKLDAGFYPVARNVYRNYVD